MPFLIEENNYLEYQSYIPELGYLTCFFPFIFVLKYFLFCSYTNPILNILVSILLLPLDIAIVVVYISHQLLGIVFFSISGTFILIWMAFGLLFSPFLALIFWYRNIHEIHRMNQIGIATDIEGWGWMGRDGRDGEGWGSVGPAWSSI